MDAMNATEHAGRTIAVDWSIPKGKYRETEEKEAAAAQAAAVENEDTEMKETSDNEESSSDDEESNSADEEENDSDNSNSDSDIEESEEELSDNEENAEARKAKKMTGPTSADGTTMFVRNLLFETTEEDLKQL